MERVVSVLYPFVSEGLRIVFSEPRIGLAIKLVFPKVLGSERALLVSEQCYDIHRFLLELYDRGELCLEFGEIETTLGYHHACHLRALGVGEEPLALLGLVPGLKVRAFSEHCCGMGGTFGMMREHFDLSMAIGEPLFKAIKEMNPREVATSCEACRLQIFQGTGKRAVHPISLLALAYERKDGGSSLLSFSNSSSAVESLSPSGRS
jgi:glycerol-3-phosphate dehydrogenase subunit C